MKKKFLIGLFAIIMCFALVGCGNNTTNNDGSGAESGNKKTNGLYSIKDSDITVASGLDISMVPSVIKKGVGEMRRFNVSSPSTTGNYKTSIYYSFKLESSKLENAKISLLDYYTSNGGSKEENGSIETIVTFGWGNIVVSVYSSTGSIDCVANVNQ